MKHYEVVPHVRSCEDVLEGHSNLVSVSGSRAVLRNVAHESRSV